MASRLVLFAATFGLLVTAACFLDSNYELHVDVLYNRTVEAVLNILWKSFETDIQDKSDVMFFTFPSAKLLILSPKCWTKSRRRQLTSYFLPTRTFNSI